MLLIGAAHNETILKSPNLYNLKPIETAVLQSFTSTTPLFPKIDIFLEANHTKQK